MERQGASDQDSQFPWSPQGLRREQQGGARKTMGIEAVAVLGLIAVLIIAVIVILAIGRRRRKGDPLPAPEEIPSSQPVSSGQWTPASGAPNMGAPNMGAPNMGAPPAQFG